MKTKIIQTGFFHEGLPIDITIGFGDSQYYPMQRQADGSRKRAFRGTIEGNRCPKALLKQLEELQKREA